jgi:hypothetical protein
MRFLVDLERELQRIWARFTAGLQLKSARSLAETLPLENPFFA